MFFELKTRVVGTVLFFAALFVVLYSCRKTNEPATNTLAYAATPVLPDTVFHYYSLNASLKYDEQATLGRVLFYDKHLSVNNTVACASCHKQEWSFSDNVPLSSGYDNRPSGRNALPLIDVAAFGELYLQGTGTMFWDGRESDILYLALRPLSNHIEMGTDLKQLPAKLAALPYYAALFKEAYGDETITEDRIAECLARFVKAIVVKNSRLDLAKAGKISLSALEQDGQIAFKEIYKCGECHKRFAEGYAGAEFMNIGLDVIAADKGRYVITQQDSDMGKFRLPNLDNVEFTAPYMHDGRYKTLEEVLDFYEHGIQRSANLDHRLQDKNGNALRMNITPYHRQAIIAYLKARSDRTILTDTRFSNPFLTH